MSVPELHPGKYLRPRLILFRVLGGILLALAVLGFAAVMAGIYFTWTEESESGWFAVALFAALGVVVYLLAVVGIRAMRIKSVDELEQQGRSRWLER